MKMTSYTSYMNLKGVILLSIFSHFLMSCGDDSEPEPVSPIVGVWELDLVEDTDFPVGFTGNSDVFSPTQLQIQVGDLIVPVEEWRLELSGDNTYVETVEVPGPNSVNSGTYVYESDDLELTPDDVDLGFITDYTVEDLNETELSLSFPFEIRTFPDAIWDTLTVQWTQEFEDANAVVVQGRRIFFYEKSND